MQPISRPSRALHALVAAGVAATALAVAAPAAQASALAGGPLVLMGIDAEDWGHGAISTYAAVVDSVYDEATPATGNGILVIGGGKPFTSVTSFWNDISSHTGIPVTQVSSATAISNADFSQYRMLAVASDYYNTPGGLEPSENDALTARKTDIANFINADGGLFGLTSDWFGSSTSYGYLTEVGTFSMTTGAGYSNVSATPEGAAIGLDNTSLDVCCWHDYYDVFPSFLKPLATDASNGRVAAIGGLNVQIPTGVTLTPASGTGIAGGTHTVSAEVKDANGVPQPDVTVDFEVLSGPNAGQTSTAGGCSSVDCETDGSGSTSWTYTSNGLAGSDIIRACFTDLSNQVRCATSAFEWEVSPAATATDDAYTTPEDVVLTGNVLANDHNATTATLVTGTTNGTLVLGTDGAFTYTPDANFHGSDSFTYTAANANPNSTSGVAMVSLTVTSVNDAPSCAAVTGDVATFWAPNNKLSPVTLSGGSDADGDPISLAITGVTQDERLTLRGAPDAQAGSDAAKVLLRNSRDGRGDGRVYVISYTLSDGQGGVCSGNHTVTVVHDQSSPAAVDSGQTVNSFGI